VLSKAVGHEKRGVPKRAPMRCFGPSAFGIGGLRENWKDPATREWIRTFAIITTDANELTAEIHDRMPLILAPSDYARWLSDEPTVLGGADADMAAPRGSTSRRTMTPRWSNRSNWQRMWLDLTPIPSGSLPRGHSRPPVRRAKATATLPKRSRGGLSSAWPPRASRSQSRPCQHRITWRVPPFPLVAAPELQ
jgi:hypothetical protein